MATTVKVSRIQKRGQVTIPVEIRQRLHLEEGDLVAFIETKEGIILSPQEVVPATPRNNVEARAKQEEGDMEELFTFADRLAAQDKLDGKVLLDSAEGPSIVEQTAGIFRQRQGGQKGAIDFEQARQAFIEYLAHQTADEATNSQS